MEGLIASNVLLWLIVAVMGLVILALSRQVGVLHERSAPLGAVIADKGPEIGDDAPIFELEDFSGQKVAIGGKREGELDTLLLFLAPNCPMCNKLLPTARKMAAYENLDVVVVSDGPREEHAEFLRKHDLGDIPYVVSANVGIRLQIGRVPYAMLIDSDGKIRAKGLVNTREHLESLLEAKAMGVPSMQEYLKQRKNGGRPDGLAEIQSEPEASRVTVAH
jgi:methylamine dehydrogenase accessory protein MauD